MPHARSPELRLFISSTFIDMTTEREYLVKHIFPEIRAIARERGIEFTEIDLRWGITVQEVEEGKTIKTCLSEVDRCRPYFIGLIGSRYGWQPTQEDIRKDTELLEHYPWVEEAVGKGMSVTEMEMSYGALAENAGRTNAFFYSRKADETTEEPVLQLRNRIKTSGYPILEDYANVEELGARVREDMLRLIDEQFPVSAEPTPLEAERSANDAFAHTRRRAYVPNPVYLRKLSEYVSDTNPERKPMVVVGKSGGGKSSLIAFWTNEYRLTHPDKFVITHYVGAAHSSPASVIRHLMLEIKERGNFDEVIPEQVDELERDLPQWLAKLPDQKILIVLDAVNQLDDPRGHGLNWLPSFIPPNIRLILSTTDDAYGTPAEEHTLAQRGWEEFVVEPLSTEQRHEVTKYYLSQYHKSLTRPQLEALATNEKCASPLFLRTILEELRIFGRYKEIDERIAHFLASADTDDLFQRVLERMEQDYGLVAVRQVMSLIGASRHGLSENELLGLLTHINRLDLSKLLHALDYHLIRNAGLLNFFHMYLRRAVERRYNHGDQECRGAHRQLAEYFHAQAADKRRADEEPYNWQRAEDMDGLKRCLSDVPLLFILLDEERRHELIIYWKNLREHTDIKDLYYDVVGRYIEEHTEDEHAIKLYKMLGDALTTSSDYKIAEDFLRKALAMTIEKYGEDSLEVADAKTDLGGVLYHRGIFDEAEKILQSALSVKETTLGEDNDSYAQTLNDLGAIYYSLAKFDKAEDAFQNVVSIYQRLLNRNTRKIADTLVNLGTVSFILTKYDDAKQSFLEALDTLKRAYGSQHMTLIPCLRNLAMVEDKLTDTAQAETYYKEAIMLCSTIYGKYSKEMGHTLGNMAVFYSRKGRYEDSLKLHLEAQKIRKDTLGNDHFTTLNGYVAIGLNLLRLNREEEGIKLLERYLSKLSLQIGSNDNLVITAETLWEQLHPDSFSKYKNALNSLNEQGHVLLNGSS